MPNAITMWCCNKCGSLYKDYDSSMQCENLPVAPAMYVSGQPISFEDESSSFGTRYCYSGKSGTVLISFIGRVDSEQGPKHVRIYIAKVDGAVPMEVEIYAGDNGNLFSPAECKFRPGYAALRAQELIEEGRIQCDLGSFGRSIF